MAYASVDYTLKASMQDVRNDIRDVSNRNLLEITREIANELPGNATQEQLIELARKYEVSEINVVDSMGIITASSTDDYIGFDMTTGGQSSEFLILLNGTKEFAQAYQPI